MKIESNWRNFVKDNLRGDILEISPFFQPFPLNDKTNIIYIDKCSREELLEVKKQNKIEIENDNIIEPNVIIDTHCLCFKDETFDNVVNSHVFEHLYNPIKALGEWIRVLKRNGFLYIVVPDKTLTFDKDREITPESHIVDDYNQNMNHAEFNHYLDAFGHNKEIASDHFNKRSDIHLHTFTHESLISLLETYSKYFGYEILDHKLIDINICVLLKKL